MLDLTRLTPAPWYVTGFDTVREDGRTAPETYVVAADDTWLCRMMQDGCDDDAEFIALARNVLDVLLRRGWGVMCHEGKFAAVRPALVPVDGRRAHGIICVMHEELSGGFFPDPFTAVVEADRWLTAREAGAASPSSSGPSSAAPSAPPPSAGSG